MVTYDAAGACTGDATRFADEIYAHRHTLRRIAQLQLRDDELADDVVQETYLAALQSRLSFAGKSKLKTWLIGILRFKIVDALRSRAKTPIPTSDLEKELDIADIEEIFDSEGIWKNKPKAWQDPASELHQADFLRVMELCLEKLPPNSARVFMLRELFDLDAEEICAISVISPNHLGVLLYRARMSLRRCLEVNWLGLA